MIVAAAVSPHPPALLPAVGQAIATDLAGVRTACLDAVHAVLAAEPDLVVVSGPGVSRGWDESAGGTFRGFGPDVRVGGPELVLPPALTVGAWLLDGAGWSGPRQYGAQPEAGGPNQRVGVLVMADGSARHRRLAPEWVDVEGRAFDAEVARALSDGDAHALATLDLAAATSFGASGVDGLVALGRLCDGAAVRARLHVADAPFDVGYWVADWVIGPEAG